MACRSFTWIASSAVLAVLILYSEYLLPYVYTLDWTPSKCPSKGDCVKILAVSDPQLQGYHNELGGILGTITRWDADRYLSSMFSRAVAKLSPDIVVMLGDLIDEAYSATNSELDDYYSRFDTLFATSKVPIISLPGDNDIGGEGVEVQTPEHITKFEARHGKVNDIVLQNDMAFVRLNLFSLMRGTPREIRMSLDAFINNFAAGSDVLHETWPVILMSHLPIHELRNQELQSWILNKIRPDFILSGHTHEYYQFEHVVAGKKVDEVTVPTISYRMGTSKIGVVLLEVDRTSRQLYVHNYHFPPRYPQLVLYGVWVCFAIALPYIPSCIRKLLARRIKAMNRDFSLDSF